MNAQELERVMRLGLNTVGEVGRYLKRMKRKQNELHVLAIIKQVY